jgi:hypothetical protein
MKSPTVGRAKELYDNWDRLNPSQRAEIGAKTGVGALFLAKGMAEGGMQTHAIEADSPVGKVLADSAPSIRVVDSAAAARDLVEADTKLRPDAPPRTAPAVAQKPIYNMTPDELQTAEIADRGQDTAMLKQLFGDDGAKRYNSLQRAANGTNIARADKAIDELALMESKLTPEQQAKLFGTGETGPTYEDFADYRRALGNISGDTAAELGESMRYAITKLGKIQDPAKMSPGEQQAFSQLRHGFEIADEQGWNKDEVLQAALRGAAARFSPEDAAFMLKQFTKSAAVPSEVSQGRTTGPTDTAALLVLPSQSLDETSSRS